MDGRTHIPVHRFTLRRVTWVSDRPEILEVLVARVHGHLEENPDDDDQERGAAGPVLPGWEVDVPQLLD
jgi:hypothetical protein